MVYSREKERELFAQVCKDLDRIHNVKSETYGDSWRKRGELLSVFGNLARKFDRLEQIVKDQEKFSKAINDEFGEAYEDTVIDLAVYAVLYCTWLKENRSERYDRAVMRSEGKEVLKATATVVFGNTPSNEFMDGR